MRAADALTGAVINMLADIMLVDIELDNGMVIVDTAPMIDLEFSVMVL